MQLNDSFLKSFSFFLKKKEKKIDQTTEFAGETNAKPFTSLASTQVQQGAN